MLLFICCSFSIGAAELSRARDIVWMSVKVKKVAGVVLGGERLCGSLVVGH